MHYLFFSSLMCLLFSELCLLQRLVHPTPETFTVVTLGFKRHNEVVCPLRAAVCQRHLRLHVCLLFPIKGAFCSSAEEMLTSRERSSLLCLYVADPATSPAPHSVVGLYSPLRAACLLTDGQKFVLLPRWYFQYLNWVWKISALLRTVAAVFL